MQASTADLEKRISKLEDENLQMKASKQRMVYWLWLRCYCAAMVDVLARLRTIEGQRTTNKDDGAAESDDFDLFGSDDEEQVANVQADPPRSVNKPKSKYLNTIIISNMSCCTLLRTSTYSQI